MVMPTGNVLLVTIGLVRLGGGYVDSLTGHGYG